MTTIFAIMICYYGQCRPDPNGLTFRTLAECKAAKVKFDHAMANTPTIHYICAKKTVPTWQPAE